MAPALRFLARVAPQLPMNPVTYFVFTGALSSRLDNAPTYAVFFQLANGYAGPDAMAGVREINLIAISLGAVLCGGLTYVGNGPNLMIKTIAERAGIGMPSVAGYVVRWSLVCLLPVLVAVFLIFVVQDWKINSLGIALALLLAARDLGRARRARRLDPSGSSTHGHGIGSSGSSSSGE